MLPAGYVAHRINGRIRIRIPSKRRDFSYFESLQQKLKACEGVDALQANPLTGGVLLLHHANLPSIAQFAEQNQLFILTEEAPTGPVSQQIAQRFQVIDQRLQAFSAGKIDLSGAAFFGLTTLGLFQLLRRNVAPAGLTLLWYAISVLPKRRGT